MVHVSQGLDVCKALCQGHFDSVNDLLMRQLDLEKKHTDPPIPPLHP